MKKANIQLNKIYAILAALFFVINISYADNEILPVGYRLGAQEQALAASQGKGRADLGVFMRASLKSMFSAPVTSSSSSKRSALRGVVGGTNFSAADVDKVMIPISTSNGPGVTDLWHDGGEWPNTGGIPSLDDGSASGDSLAQEIYDYDGNRHYPKAVLRYIGTHCYIFVPVMFFPTLPTPISSSETETPAALAEWGMTWHHDSSLYYSPNAPGSVLEPRYILGSTKEAAKQTLQRIADKFDQEIYPKVREYLGDEPDIDGDSRIFILLDDIRDYYGSYLGYFWAGNEFSRSSIPLSNEKEILFVDIHRFMSNPSDSYGTIAHEFSHMINYNNGFDVVNGELKGLSTWIDEGIATFIEHKFDGLFSSNVDAFLDKPDTRLVETRDSVWVGTSPFANYGASFLWLYYICEKYGESNLPSFLKTITSYGKNTGNYDDIECFNAALKTSNTTFKEVFKDWCIANILDTTVKNDLITPLNNGKWGYKADKNSKTIGYNRRLPVSLTESVLLSSDSTSRSSKVNPWAANYIKLEGNNGNLNVAFDGDDRGTFSAALIKQGKFVNTDVENFILNSKNSGNIVVQNYGTSGTYEHVILVPMQTGTYNDSAMSYVFAGTFAELRVAIFPNPLFENNLHVLVKSDNKFAAEPRVQMTYGSAQFYMTMAPVDEYTYISNYTISSSGEGTLVVTGSNSNGALLTNTLKFSAVYYPAKSAGSLSASFARLNIPSGAFDVKGTAVAAEIGNPVSYAGVKRLSGNIDVAFPTTPKKDIQISIPITADVNLNDTIKKQIGLYRATTDGLKWVSKASINTDNSIEGNMNFSGTVFAAYDDVAPEIIGEPEVLIAGGKTAFQILEEGSGLDESTVKVVCNGKILQCSIDENNRIIANTTGINSGEQSFEIEIADKVGNVMRASINGDVVNQLSLDQVLVYPNPSKNGRSVIRAKLSGGTGGMLNNANVSVKIYDASGHKVKSGVLTRINDGIYEYNWNLSNEKGKRVANGIYFAEVKTSANGINAKNRIKIAVLK